MTGSTWIGSTCAHAQSDAPAGPGEYRQLASGLLGRSLFKGEAGKNTVEIIDLLVGPLKASDDITTPDRAMLDVQAGEATLVVDGISQRVKPGTVVTLDRDQRISIDNSGTARPFTARLIVVSSTQR